ncbi:class I SAM-dependent methyltransferase [Phenylobacterium immobile]|uniref:class I SAM-dependent methyltransferase n=1 Tax=Phenylobacterium immobile TaxID=21 RepID=UPI000A625D17|nr:class I SAM-dependent methyltransferase [Phenylobacterium immobile]
MNPSAIVYGAPSPGLIEVPTGAVQTSPLIPGSADLAEIAPGSLASAHVLAPPGVAERAYVTALAFRALAPGGRLVLFAPKDKGGQRLKALLQGFGCEVAEDARKHHRFCFASRPAEITGLDAAIAAGAPRLSAELGLWTQPGVFSWDRIDPGSALLMQALDGLAGAGADLGCGIGALSAALLGSPTVTTLHGVDVDGRAIACAQRNLSDPRMRLAWADVRRWTDAPSDLDFVVMNPPFHDGGSEDKALGQAFIRAAAAMLRAGGTLRLVANRHLPYEAVLREAFAAVTPIGDAQGYKLYEARR